MAELGFDGYALDYLEYPRGMEYYLKDMNLHRNVGHLVSQLAAIRSLFRQAICRRQNLDVARAMDIVGQSGGAWFTNGKTMNQVTRSRYGRKAVGNMTRDIPEARSFVHPPGKCFPSSLNQC
jgi:structural maintenance of chromosomes protein 5